MYKLTKKEKIELDNYWNFIDCFKPYGKKSTYHKNIKREFKGISWLNNSSI